jgi:5-bromo-4-chloroindolyl phosphate hydrolysis protein
MLIYRKNIIRFDILNTLIAIIIFILLFTILEINIIISGILAMLIYIGSALLFAPNNKLVLLGIKDSNKQKEYMNLLDNGYDNYEKIINIKNQITKPHIKQECNDIIGKIAKILKYLEKHKKFFTYYLETIYKIVNSYFEISSQNIHTKEIEDVISKTEKTLVMINKSLDDQFTKMIQNDALDLDTEIDFLKSSIQMKDF